MPFSITEFAAKGLPFGGARSSHFQVILDVPSSLGRSTFGERMAFTCKAAQIPGSTLGIVTVPYFGRQIKVAGNRTFEEWTVTILNDEDFEVRHTLEEWSNAINRHEANLRDDALTQLSQYRTTGLITQFAKSNRELRTYRLVNVWPSDVQAVDLNWENEGIQEFQVTFAYDYWDIERDQTGRGTLNA